MAYFIGAVFAPDRRVGAVPEPLRMAGVDVLPPKRHDACGKKQAPAEKAFDKKHGRIHHKMAPVENPAVDAAAIFHNKCLEGAEYQHADQIRQKIEKRQ